MLVPAPSPSWNVAAVKVSGHKILSEISLEIQAGEHVAIVGPSGAGKSSLVGLLMGWHRATSGRILADDQPIRGDHLYALRRSTAWVDAEVQLWNRSLLDNLQYGAPNANRTTIGEALEYADLYPVLEKLPNGLQTTLGEGGRLVSGGEGQRVRLGRALLRPDVRLVILDEPFRGLDRAQRWQLLADARKHWQSATLFCITHDVSETLHFERVIVVKAGKIVEDGVPGTLASQPSSHYRALLEAEDDVRKNMWDSADWRRLRLEDGQLTDLGSPPVPIEPSSQVSVI